MYLVIQDRKAVFRVTGDDGSRGIPRLSSSVSHKQQVATLPRLQKNYNKPRKVGHILKPNLTDFRHQERCCQLQGAQSEPRECVI